MIRLAYIDLGSRLVQYFVEVSKLLKPEVEVYFFCLKPKPRSIAKQSGFPTFPESFSPAHSGLIPENIQERVFNDKILTENPDVGKLRKKLERIYPSLQQFLEQQQIDAVFLWNGSGLASSIAIYLAHERGLKTLFGENGYFYNTIQLDPSGVNQAASITPKIAREYARTELEPAKLEQLRQLIDIYRNNESVTYTPGQNLLKASWLARIAGEIGNLREVDLRWRGTYNKTIPSSIERLPERYIFIPFQVVRDSQLLLYSPLVGNDMELFIERCHAAVQQVARDYKIVVKLHPADLDNVDYSQLPQRFPDVVFLKDTPSNRLIQASSLVITINSTVGVEALLHDKPVITLGDNFYNVPGVVRHVNALSELPQAIEAALNTPPDREKIQRLLYYLYHEYFAQGSWKNFSPQSIQAVATKISRLLSTDE